MIGWRGSVHEIQFLVIEAMLYESLCVVHFNIQSNYCRYVMDAEVVQVLFGLVIYVAVFDFLFVVRSTEGKKLIGHNPIEITIFDHFIVAVLFVIKVVKVEEASLHPFVNGIETIEQSYFVCRRYG